VRAEAGLGSSSFSIFSRGRLPILFLLLTMLGVAVVSREAFFVLARSLPLAAAVMLPPIGLGLVLVPLFRFLDLPVRWRLLLAAALGLGATSILVLCFGLLGLLHRGFWCALLLLFAIMGLLRLRGILARPESGAARSRASGAPNRESFLWLIAVPFLVAALLAASNPPGFLWSEEGYGYDVLEYHLQVPKEYFLQGEIAYASHNVYANFPMNVEMLYLLAMIVNGKVTEVGTTAHLIHLSFALLSVFAAATVASDVSPRTGLIAGILLATTGWLPYLSGLAYVENALFFYGFLAVGSLLRGRESTSPAGWIILSGLMAGLACGCKYTAVLFLVAPVGLCAICANRVALTRRLSLVLLFLLSATAAFSPWLLKNQWMTGNPVFPLANSLFQADPPGWGTRETEQWDRGHSVSWSTHSFAQRIGSIWTQILGNRYQRFGLFVLLFPLFLFIQKRRNETNGLLGLIALMQLLGWTMVTHLYARFAAVLLIPLVLLAARAVTAFCARPAIFVPLAVTVAAWNFAFVVDLHRQESDPGAPETLISEGILPGFEYYEVVNRQLPAPARILLVGEARAYYFEREVDCRVVFNAQPFAEVVKAAKNDDEILAWLRDRGFTHVLVHWSEIQRLAGTYGFPGEITLALFERLERAGLSPVRFFPHPLRSGERYVDLWAVPQGNP